jgi:hypothetical protein
VALSFQSQPMGGEARRVRANGRPLEISAATATGGSWPISDIQFTPGMAVGRRLELILNNAESGLRLRHRRQSRHLSDDVSRVSLSQWGGDERVLTDTGRCSGDVRVYVESGRMRMVGCR